MPSAAYPAGMAEVNVGRLKLTHLSPRSVVDHSNRRIWSIPLSVHMGLMLDKAAEWDRFLSSYFSFSPVSIFPPRFHFHILSLYQWRHTILANDNVLHFNMSLTHHPPPPTSLLPWYRMSKIIHRFQFASLFLSIRPLLRVLKNAQLIRSFSLRFNKEF